MSQRPTPDPRTTAPRRLQRIALAWCLAFALVACQREAAAPTTSGVEGPPPPGACVPVLRDGWLRPGPPGMSMMAGFGTIENGCGTTGTVVSVRSPAFGSVEIHESRLGDDGVSRMRPVPRLAIEPGEAATLAPGGLHLMLMQPAGPLEAGQSVDITFVLEDGREVTGRLEILPL